MDWPRRTYAYARYLLFGLYIILYCVYPNVVIAQNYGLSFIGHEEPVLEKRTSLDLSGDKMLCLSGDFDLSFSIRLNDTRSTNFGYVFRMIGERSQNIDLMVDGWLHKPEKAFTIVAGNRFTKIIFQIDFADLVKNWHLFRLVYSSRQKKLTFYLNNRIVGQQDYQAASQGCYKILFGAHSYQSFRSTDVPSMKLKDIKLASEGVDYHWPLNEENGNIAHEIRGKINAITTNPVWINKLHNSWKLEKSFAIQRRNISVAFNEKSEELYFIGLDSLYRYSISTALLSLQLYSKKPDYLPAGNQAIYDPINDRLCHFTAQEKKLIYYDTLKNKWNGNFQKLNASSYWHANKFISKYDTSLYIIGGYGHFWYRNHINRYNLKTDTWELSAPPKQSFHPRYLAGLGVNDGTDTAYIIGGYGSHSGDQMLNPRYYYDLQQFTVKDKKFKKLYTFEPEDYPFTFASSLVINTKKKEFYGLIFPNQSYNSFLQLVKGSLERPGFEFSAQKIPYTFHDIRSYADLYYCKKLSKLIAVTLFQTEERTTRVAIYSISFPPNLINFEAQKKDKNNAVAYVTGAICLAILSIILILFYRNKKTDLPVHIPVLAGKFIVDDPINIAGPKEADASLLPANVETPLQTKSAIYLFGGLQVFDRDGNDITRLFTPLIKELFMLLMIYSVRGKNGVSSEKLYEILWQDKSKKDALNNRSVNMAKLRLILEKVGNIVISKSASYWSLGFDPASVYVDYNEFKQIAAKSGEENAAILFKLIRNGGFLKDVDYDWLDDYKTEISDKIDGLFSSYAQSAHVNNNPTHAVEVANSVFNFDPLNEHALTVKCRALNRMRKYSQSLHTYEKFVKEYNATYSTTYPVSYQTVAE